ncbi:hypothetical protein SCOCK_170091 [Actinacidiphila cocklensis]|uniref:Uncharacterized protein n=1 Tax=Actinacidiphila cocklensis TaxID=887465 RepID=A0A9W4GPM5_9ACTN|nr:hypothetical protein SCOCK_170091 [Actinacidiphila cocklensis]
MTYITGAGIAGLGDAGGRRGGPLPASRPRRSDAHTDLADQRHPPGAQGAGVPDLPAGGRHRDGAAAPGHRAGLAPARLAHRVPAAGGDTALDAAAVVARRDRRRTGRPDDGLRLDGLDAGGGLGTCLGRHQRRAARLRGQDRPPPRHRVGRHGHRLRGPAHLSRAPHYVAPACRPRERVRPGRA